MHLVIHQLSPSITNKEKNLQIMEKSIKKNKGDLHVFSELFLTGYRCRDEFFRLAEPMEGGSVKKVKKIAKENNCGIIFGMPEFDEATYNSAVFVREDEEVNVYRKNFLASFGPFEEKLYFKNGKELKVFETKFGKIGVLICYDIFFPEICRTYALQGSKMLICISASPLTSKEYFEKIMFARAIENTNFFVYCNLVGLEENLPFFGGSAIIGPRGDLKAKAKYFKEQILKYEIDLNEIEVAKGLRPVLRDLTAREIDIEDAFVAEKDKSRKQTIKLNQKIKNKWV